MAIPLDTETRIALTPTATSEISNCLSWQKESVHTQLVKIARADHTPDSFVYKQYGDLKVFRCGDVMRLFGVIVENLGSYVEYDHLVIILEVSDHDYDGAGATKQQARALQKRIHDVTSESDLESVVSGKIFTAREIEDLID